MKRRILVARGDADMRGLSNGRVVWWLLGWARGEIDADEDGAFAE